MRREIKKGDIVTFIEDRWICAGARSAPSWQKSFEVMSNDTGLVLDVIEYKEPNLATWLTVLINGQIGHLSIRKPWPVR